MATWDVFVSYRWVEPDQGWVRTELVPKLRAAGLRVLLDVAIDGFVPGRDAICEMARAGRESRRTLSVWTPEYFADDRAVWFESLQARRRDPQGRHSTLVPLLLRTTDIPGEFHGLIPIDWTDPARRATEWARLLAVLRAPPPDGQPPPHDDQPTSLDVLPPVGCPSLAIGRTVPGAIEPEAARRRVLADISARLATRDQVERYWLYIALGLTGGDEARDLLKHAADAETEPFARLGIEDAMGLLPSAAGGTVTSQSRYFSIRRSTKP
jgi:hypothetical protein